MERPNGFRKLADYVLRTLSEASEEVFEPTAGRVIPNHRVLDLYVVSGSLERALVAFIGALEDYIDQRAVLGEEANGVAEYELIWSTDFFAQAIEALTCVAEGLDPNLEDSQPSSGSSSGPQMDTGIRTRLREAVHFEATDLDGYRDILALATRYHELLREAAMKVRKHIRRTFDFSDLFA